MASDNERPTLEREERLWSDGFPAVAGIDEAGRGALAGPVTAAAVVLPKGAPFSGIWTQVRDSKLLSPALREELATEIRVAAFTWGIGDVQAATIDQIGIAAATRRAMAAATAALTVVPDYLLIDWVRLPAVNIAQESFAKADQRCVSVAAASILAKVHRDRLLVELAQVYPCYHFASNKGYGSQAHRDAIVRHGPCPEHRHMFSPIANRPTLFDQAEDDGRSEGA